MYRMACLLVVGFMASALLVSMTRSAAAEPNCPTGATCKCVPTIFTECKVDPQGRQYDCKTSKGQECTVISGPGSGNPAAVAQPAGTVAQPDTGTGTVRQPDKVKAIGSKELAPGTPR
jgi:hypothetical protein